MGLALRQGLHHIIALTALALYNYVNSRNSSVSLLLFQEFSRNITEQIQNALLGINFNLKEGFLNKGDKVQKPEMSFANWAPVGLRRT